MSDSEDSPSPTPTPTKRTRRSHSPAIKEEIDEEGPDAEAEEQEHEEPPSCLASLGLQRVGSAPPPKPQPQQPRPVLNARGMPARKRRLNRLFFDENIINDDKPLRMSLSPRKTPLKGAGGGGTNAASTSSAGNSPARTPKSLKKRKLITPARYQQSPTVGKEDKRQTSRESSVVSTPTRGGSRRRSGSTTNTTPKTYAKGGGGGSLVAATPQSSSASSGGGVTMSIDKKVGQRIGLRLRNLLKLPKAHKWVIYEWFYSFIDKPLFEGPNDFQNSLEDSFQKLRVKKLTRFEWQKIRASFGKPRRCSSLFFAEERRELERKRNKARYLQTRKSGDIGEEYIREMPDKIPLALPVGTKVTARLRSPQDGIFGGVVDAFDSVTSSYRITFDRVGLGTHSVPDIEIVSENFHEMLPVHSITKDFRPHLNLNPFSPLGGSGCYTSPLRGSGLRGVRSALNMNLNKSDPLLGQEVIESPFKNPVINTENIHGYPAKLLENIVRLRRALKSKRVKLQRLNEMNNEAELKASQQLTGAGNTANSEGEEPLNAPTEIGVNLGEEFQRRYASNVISMEKMNRDMQDYLNHIQSFATELTRDPQVQAMLAPSYLREKCREAAEDSVQRNNQGLLKNKNVLGLIKNLATVLLVASHLGIESNSAQVSKVLEGCMEEVRSALYAGNIETFQKNVQIHLHHIRLGIGQSMMNTSTNVAAVDR